MHSTLIVKEKTTAVLAVTEVTLNVTNAEEETTKKGRENSGNEH